MPVSTSTEHLATLDRLLKDASPGDSLARIFENVTDEFWWWAFTDGYRADSRLAQMLPAFPPEDVQYRFTGAASDQTMRPAFDFYTVVRQMIREHRTEPTKAILEFGCGWGRIIRLFLRDVEPEHLWGVDCMRAAIELCKETNKYCTFQLTDPLPPSTLATGSFDLVYAYSVFSHLSEEAHLRWLREFVRILRPGGLIIVTTRPRDFILWCAEMRAQQERGSWANATVAAFRDTQGCLERFDRGEFLYESFGGGDVLDASFFGETCIPREYVARTWSQYVDVLDFIDERAVCEQNVIVARRRG